MAWLRRSFWSVLKRVLFWLDPESAHHLTLRLIQGLDSLGVFGRLFLRLSSGECQKLNPNNRNLRRETLGMSFDVPIGLAAGMDKNAEILTALPFLGFGFAEVGTVTMRPQPGNPRPRLFRLVEERSLFNRMGFNSLGAACVLENLKRARQTMTFAPNFKIGVNLGMNKDTPLEKAHEDYGELAKAFGGLADYLVLNVSSPNTPGLRSLQESDHLEKIFKTTLEGLKDYKNRPPVLFKLAPEVFFGEKALENSILKEWIGRLDEMGVSGWVISNTWGGVFNGQSGGFSGNRIKEASEHALKRIRPLTQRPIISVGGIMDTADVRKRFEMGADLIQVYSGWIFNGPGWISEIKMDLSKTKKPRI